MIGGRVTGGLVLTTPAWQRLNDWRIQHHRMYCAKRLIETHRIPSNEMDRKKMAKQRRPTGRFGQTG